MCLKRCLDCFFLFSFNYISSRFANAQALSVYCSRLRRNHVHAFVCVHAFMRAFHNRCSIIALSPTVNKANRREHLSLCLRAVSVSVHLRRWMCVCVPENTREFIRLYVVCYGMTHNAWVHPMTFLPAGFRHFTRPQSAPNLAAQAVR